MIYSWNKKGLSRAALVASGSQADLDNLDVFTVPLVDVYSLSTYRLDDF